jgi:hypothetical protein
MTYIPAVVANVSTVNSTTAALPPGGVFTGTPEDVSQYASLSVSYYVQPPTATGNIIIQFSNTSSVTNWIPISNTVSPVLPVTANGFTLDTTMTLQYFRALYVNDSTQQTQLTVSTVYHPQARVAQKSNRFAETPTDTTDAMNTRAYIWAKTTGSGIYESIAGNGENSLVTAIADPRTAFGEINVSEKLPVSQIDFVYGINTTVTNSVVINSATIGATNGVLSITSGTSGSVGTPAVGVFCTKKYAKYRPGQGVETVFTAAFSAGQSSTIQFAGAGFVTNSFGSLPVSNIVDGIGAGYNGTSFGFAWYEHGTAHWVPQATFNFDRLDGSNTVNNKSGFNIVPANINLYKVKFQYLGGGNMFYYVMNPVNGRWILAHIIQLAGTRTVPVFANPTMPIMYYANSYSASTVTVSGASAAQFLEGLRSFLGPKGGFDYNQNVGAGTQGAPSLVFALQNAITFNGQPNRSQVRIRTLACSSAGSSSSQNVFNMRAVRNPSTSLTGWTAYNGTWSSGNIVTGQSTVSNCIQSTTITGGATGFTMALGIGACQIIDIQNYDIVLYPGDILAFCAYSSTGAGYVDVAVTWVEDI